MLHPHSNQIVYFFLSLLHYNTGTNRLLQYNNNAVFSFPYLLHESSTGEGVFFLGTFSFFFSIFVCSLAQCHIVYIYDITYTVYIINVATKCIFKTLLLALNQVSQRHFSTHTEFRLFCRHLLAMVNKICLMVSPSLMVKEKKPSEISGGTNGQRIREHERRR